MAIEKIDMDLCNGCRVCVDACPVDVIRFDDGEKKPIIAYKDDCIWCFNCESVCPMDCIEIMPTKARHIPEPYKAGEQW
ncbi:MAG: 4Fe-4S dicluster domain-containing protein [Chloroflexi bacterium]|nr:4Fe-4S dicluster domain-containing protein [Chloroflexota bacterium]